MLDKKLLSSLKHYFGYDSFRMNQQQIIESILNKKDTLALLPTGGGKSIIYQLPALISDGVCLVISPLLALMKDQVIQLQKRGIPSAYISSEMSSFELQNELEKAQKQEIKILYLSPERISNYHFINALKYIKVSFIAVDEAHCISEWGNDFRPSYQNIKDFRVHLGNIPCIALTATATKKTISDIIIKLGFKNTQIFQNSFQRTNISVQFLKSDEKINHIIYLLKKHIGSSLIYCRTRRETQQLYKILKDKNLLVDYFHAGLSTFEKQKRQKNWTDSNFQTLICTNAFGMGIDKSNVRLVIHLSPPYSIENYYQEIGRAGRDSKESYAYLLWNDSELQDWESNLVNSIVQKTEYQKIIKTLFSKFCISEGEKSNKIYDFDLKEFQKKIQISRSKIKIVIKYLENSELIYINKNNSESKIKFKCNPNQINYLENTRYQILELLSRKIMGAFTQEISFSEQNLSEYLGISIEKLKNELHQLESENWIEYFYIKGDSLRFIQSRKDDYWINELWQKFKLNQENILFKFKELDYLITQKSSCRIRMILGYFNEQKKENCGICDICLKKEFNTKNRKIRLELYKFIEEKPRTLQDIFFEFIQENPDELTNNIQELLNEEIIKNQDFITYTIK